MVLLKENDVCVRSMKDSDIDAFVLAFKEQGWNKTRELFAKYYNEQNNSKRIIIVADINNAVAGYLTLLPSAEGGPFYGRNIPEIKDFNVLIKYRRRGIGSKIMDVAENIAKENSSQISLGVGLYPDYGAAQIMYVKRGYVPDGSGVWHGENHLKPYETCRNDDDLNLYLIKQLRE